MKHHGRRGFLRGSLALAGASLLIACDRASRSGSDPRKVARVGFLFPNSPQTADSNLTAFREGMRAHGYQEGPDYVLEIRSADGRLERLPSLADELVKVPVDIIVTGSAPPTVAAKSATTTVPIVMGNVGGDPVALGLVRSLSQPGGNVTGSVNLNAGLTAKRVDLLKQMLPAFVRLATLHDATNPVNDANLAEAQSAALTLGVQLQILPVQRAEDLDAAFEAAVRQHADALLVPGSSFFQLNRAQMVDSAVEHRLPAVYEERQFAEAGGLMAYGANQQANYRNAAAYVDKILRGAKPDNLPIEQPTTFEFVINLKTAQALGLTIPQGILAQATEVIQ